MARRSSDMTNNRIISILILIFSTEFKAYLYPCENQINAGLSNMKFRKADKYYYHRHRIIRARAIKYLQIFECHSIVKIVCMTFFWLWIKHFPAMNVMNDADGLCRWMMLVSSSFENTPKIGQQQKAREFEWKKKLRTMTSVRAEQRQREETEMEGCERERERKSKYGSQTPFSTVSPSLPSLHFAIAIPFTISSPLSCPE